MAVSDTGTTTVAAAPTVSYLLALIAGVLVIINGFLLLVWETALAVPISGGGPLLGLSGIVVGLAMIFAAYRLDTRPNQHVRWGAVIILASIASLVLVGGGMLLGFILGLVSGIIAIAWRG